MKKQKGFTLIELMVVIVIIGILSALAIPKLFGMSAKAKVAEFPPVAANFETMQEAFFQETGAIGTTAAAIGFSAPTTSKFWGYTVGGGGALLTGAASKTMGTCAAGNTLTTTVAANAAGTGLDATHGGTAGCLDYVPNFKPVAAVP